MKSEFRLEIKLVASGEYLEGGKEVLVGMKRQEVLETKYSLSGVPMKRDEKDHEEERKIIATFIVQIAD